MERDNGIIFPSGVLNPSPTARTSPSCDFEALLSGRITPPRVWMNTTYEKCEVAIIWITLVWGRILFTKTLSANGIILRSYYFMIFIKTILGIWDNIPLVINNSIWSWILLCCCLRGWREHVYLFWTYSSGLQCLLQLILKMVIWFWWDHYSKSAE